MHDGWWSCATGRKSAAHFETTQEDQMRQVFRFLTGIMLGALVGSTVALLYAPESGATLRNELRARGENLIDDVREAAQTRRIEMTNRLESLREPRSM
jgi:hypothetical protein